MNFSKKQKVLMWAGAALALLIITNPSAQAFKEHQGKSSYNGLVRKYNFFICSVYHDNSRYGDYIGLVGNFLQEGEHKVATVYTMPRGAVLVDSAASVSIGTVSNNNSDGINPFIDAPADTPHKDDPNNPFIIALKKFKHNLSINHK